MPLHVLVIGDSMSLAHVVRALVAARRLEAEGKQITFATGPAYLALVRREGFDPRELFAVPPSRAIAAIRRGSHIFDMGTLQQYVASDLALIEQVQPDLILSDFRLSLNISGELTGVPYVNIVNGYMTRYYSAPQSPPQTFPIVRILGQRISRALFPTLKQLTLKYYAWNFSRYRRRLGLSPVRDIFDVISSPHANLIADLPEFIPCKGLPEHYRYVGPLIWEPNERAPDWLSDVRDGVPTVYVTMGSTGHFESLRAVLTGLRDAGFQVLATTGIKTDDLPDGIFAVPQAPGTALLRRSQAVVCHGGNLTIYQAIREGVPIVGIPTFHDQETNVERVEAVGWGVGLPPSRWRAGDLIAAVKRVGTEQFQQRVTEGQQAVRAAIEESLAGPLIPEALLNRLQRASPAG